MGLGAGKSINPMKKQRKDIMKNIDQDVHQFMKDFEEQKSSALASASNISSAADDLLSQASAVSTDQKI